MIHDYHEDRRLFPRLSFKEKALFISPDFLGLVKDISLGGLSFTYYDQVGKPPALESNAYDHGRSAEITLAKDSLLLDAANFQIIEGGHFGEGREATGTLRLCRINFNGLAGQDIMHLWRFIQEHCRCDRFIDKNAPYLPNNNESSFEFNSAA